MREMKDHELEQVVGGRVSEVAVAQTEGHFDEATRTTISSLELPSQNTAFAKAAPFLMPAINPTRKSGFARPPRNLPGAQQKQTRKGGPFTFKTPRPELSEEVPLGYI
jgi:hypothetical protein